MHYRQHSFLACRTIIIFAIIFLLHNLVRSWSSKEKKALKKLQLQLICTHFGGNGFWNMPFNSRAKKKARAKAIKERSNTLSNQSANFNSNSCSSRRQRDHRYPNNHLLSLPHLSWPPFDAFECFTPLHNFASSAAWGKASDRGRVTKSDKEAKRETQSNRGSWQSFKEAGSIADYCPRTEVKAWLVGPHINIESVQ